MNKRIIVPLISVSSAVVLGVAVLSGITLGTTHSINPVNMKTRSDFKKLKPDKDIQNSSDFRNVQNFVNSNGRGTLIARKVEKGEKFEFVYYNAGEKIDIPNEHIVFKNWAAVSAYKKQISSGFEEPKKDEKYVESPVESSVQTDKPTAVNEKSSEVTEEVDRPEEVEHAISKEKNMVVPEDQGVEQLDSQFHKPQLPLCEMQSEKPVVIPETKALVGIDSQPDKPVINPVKYDILYNDPVGSYDELIESLPDLGDLLGNEYTMDISLSESGDMQTVVIHRRDGSSFQFGSVGECYDDGTVVIHKHDDSVSEAGSKEFDEKQSTAPDAADAMSTIASGPEYILSDKLKNVLKELNFTPEYLDDMLSVFWKARLIYLLNNRWLEIIDPPISEFYPKGRHASFMQAQRESIMKSRFYAENNWDDWKALFEPTVSDKTVQPDHVSIICVYCGMPKKLENLSNATGRPKEEVKKCLDDFRTLLFKLVGLSISKHRIMLSVSGQ